jgi:hypothetical protein
MYEVGHLLAHSPCFRYAEAGFIVGDNRFAEKSPRADHVYSPNGPHAPSDPFTGSTASTLVGVAKSTI